MRLSTSSSDAAPTELHPAPVAVRGLIGRALLFVMLLLMTDRGVAWILEQGLRRYHGLDRPARVLCVGHSRTMLGLDRAMLEKSLGVPVAKYALNGANLRDRFAMIRHYLALHPGVSLVVYDVDAFTFSDHDLSSNSYRLFEPLAGDPVMGAYVRKNQCRRTDLVLGNVLHTSRFEDVNLALALRGLMGLTDNLKRGQIDFARLEQRIRTGRFRHPRLELAALHEFEEMLDWFRDRNVSLVLVDMPTVDLINGIDKDEQATVRKMFKRLSDENQGVFYVDLHEQGERRYELFFDGIHLNSKGREFLTPLVSEAIGRLPL